jgi:hypothetical protein
LYPICLGCAHSIRRFDEATSSPIEYGFCRFSDSVKIALCEVKTTSRVSKRFEVQQYYRFYESKGIEVYVAHVTLLDVNGEYSIEIAALR